MPTNKKFFKKVWKHWESRGYVACAECYLDLQYHIRYCAHIIGKGTEKQMEYDERNLMPLCQKHHRQYDQGDKEEMFIYPATQKRILELKNKYYGTI